VITGARTDADETAAIVVARYDPTLASLRASPHTGTTSGHVPRGLIPVSSDRMTELRGAPAYYSAPIAHFVRESPLSVFGALA